MDTDRIKRKIVKRKVLLAGLGLILIALLLAFASINIVTRTYESEEKSLEGDGDSEVLESRFQSINSSLEMDFIPANPGEDNEDREIEVDIIIIYEDKNVSYELESGEPKTIELEDDANFIVSYFDSSKGNITFSQTIVYETQPYGLLSIPAFVLTIISLVLVYKGKYQMKIERKIEEQEKKLKKKEESEKELSPSEQKFMGVDWGKKKQ